MTEKNIRKLLHQAKGAELSRIAKYSASGKEEQERIFARVRAAQFRHTAVQPANKVVSHAEKPSRWGWLSGLGTALAACLIVVVTVGMIVAVRRAAPPTVPEKSSVRPGEGIHNTESRIPFAKEIVGKELTFNLNAGVNVYSLSAEQQQAFLQELETLRWEQKGGGNATNEEPYRISGEFFAMYAGNGTPDGYCVVFAQDEEKILFSSLQEGSSISFYSLSAEEYDRLFQIAAAGMTTNAVYNMCHDWAIRAARNEAQAVEIPEEQTAQFWDAFQDVRLDYTRMIDPLPDAETEKPLFTVTCFRSFPDIGKEIEPYQIVFYHDRILWYPTHDAQTDPEPVKQFGIAPEDCDKLSSILFADGTQYSLRLTLESEQVTRCGLTLRMQEIAGGLSGEIMYGSDFGLEQYADGAWNPCPTVIDNAAFTSEGYSYSGETTMLPIDWRWIYGTLETGRYRISKQFSAKQQNSDAYTLYTLYAEFDITDDMGESVPLAELPFPAESFSSDEIVGLETAYAPYLAKIPSDVQQQIADAMERSYWIPVSSENITMDGESTSLFVRGKASDTPYRIEFVPSQSAVQVYVGDAETPLVYQISWELKAAAEHALDYLQETDDVMQYLIPCGVEKLTVRGVWDAVDAASKGKS